VRTSLGRNRATESYLPRRPITHRCVYSRLRREDLL